MIEAGRVQPAVANFVVIKLTVASGQGLLGEI